MASDHGEERKLLATVAAHERWARLDREARSAATDPARAALLARFENEVDPDGTLDPEERARRAANLRRAYMTRLALASARKRRENRLDRLAAEAAADLDQLDAAGGAA